MSGAGTASTAGAVSGGVLYASVVAAGATSGVEDGVAAALLSSSGLELGVSAFASLVGADEPPTAAVPQVIERRRLLLLGTCLRRGLSWRGEKTSPSFTSSTPPINAP